MVLLKDRPGFQPSTNGLAGAGADIFSQGDAYFAALLSQLGFGIVDGRISHGGFEEPFEEEQKEKLNSLNTKSI